IIWSVRAQSIPALAVLAVLIAGYVAYAFRRMNIRMSEASREHLGVFTHKFGESGQDIIRQAFDEARSINDMQFRPQHVLIAIAKLQQSQFDSLLRSLNLERDAVLQAFAGELSRRDNPVSAMKISRERSEEHTSE